MADIQTLKKYGIDGNGAKTLEVIKKLNKDDQSIFNDLQTVIQSTQGMSPTDIAKATGIPFKDWQGIVAKFSKDRERIVNKKDFTTNSFNGKYYPGKAQEIKLQRDLVKGDLATQAIRESNEQKRPRNPALDFLSGAGAGAVEDIYAQEYLKKGLDPRRVYTENETNPTYTRGREFGSGYLQGLIGLGEAQPGMTGGGKVADFVGKKLLNKPGLVPFLGRTALHLGGAMLGGEASKSVLDPMLNPRAKLPEGLREEVTALRETPTSRAGESAASLAYFKLGSRNSKGQLAFSSGQGLRSAIPQVINNPDLAMGVRSIAEPISEGINRGALAGMSIFGALNQNKQVREQLAAEGVTNPTDQQLENSGGIAPSAILTNAAFNLLLGKRTGLGDTLSMDWMGGLRSPGKGLQFRAEAPNQAGGPTGGPTAGPTSPAAGPTGEPIARSRGLFNQPIVSPEQTAINTGIAKIDQFNRIPQSEMRRSWAFTGIDGERMRLRFNTGQPGAQLEMLNPISITDTADISKSLFKDTNSVDGIKVLGMGVNGEVVIQSPFGSGMQLSVTNVNALKESYPDLYSQVVNRLRKVGEFERTKDPDRFVAQVDPNALHDYETDLAKDRTDSAFPYRVNIRTGGGMRLLQVRALPWSGETNVDTESIVRVATESGLVFHVNRTNLLNKDGDPVTEVKGNREPQIKNINNSYSRNGFEIVGKGPTLQGQKLPVYFNGEKVTQGQSRTGMLYGGSFDSAVIELESAGVKTGSLLEIPFGNNKHQAYVLDVIDLTGKLDGFPDGVTAVGVYVKDATDSRINPYFIPFRNINQVGGIKVIDSTPAAAPAPVESVDAAPSAVDTTVPGAVDTSSMPSPSEAPVDPTSGGSPAELAPTGVDTSVESIVPEGSMESDATGGGMPAATDEGAVIPSGAEETPVEETAPTPAELLAESESAKEIGADRVEAILGAVTPDIKGSVEAEHAGLYEAQPDMNPYDMSVLAIGFTLLGNAGKAAGMDMVSNGYRVTSVELKRSSANKAIEEITNDDIIFYVIRRVGGGDGYAYRLYTNNDIAAVATQANTPLDNNGWRLLTPESIDDVVPGSAHPLIKNSELHNIVSSTLGAGELVPWTSLDTVVEQTFDSFIERVVQQRQAAAQAAQTEQAPSEPAQTASGNVEPQSEQTGEVSATGQPTASEQPSSQPAQPAVTAEERAKRLVPEFQTAFNAAPEKDENGKPLSVSDAIDWMINNLQERNKDFGYEDVVNWLRGEMAAANDEHKSAWAGAILDLEKKYGGQSSDQPDITEAGLTSNQNWPYGEQFGYKIPEEQLPEYLRGREPGNEFYGMTTGEEARRLPSGQPIVQKVPQSVKPKEAMQIWAGEATPKVWSTGDIKMNLKFKGVSSRADLKGVLINTWKMKPDVAEDVSEFVDRWIIGAAKEYLRIRGYQVNQIARARRQEGKDKIFTAQEIAQFDPSDQNDLNWIANFREQAILDMTEDNLDVLARTVTQFYTERLGVFASVDRETMEQTKLQNRGMYTYIRNWDNNVVPLLLAVEGQDDVEAHVHEIIHALTGALPSPSQHLLSTSIWATDFYDQDRRNVYDLIPNSVDETFVTRFVNTMIDMSKKSKAGEAVTFVGNARLEGGYDNTFVDLLIKIGNHLNARLDVDDWHATSELPYNPAIRYPANTPVILRDNKGRMTQGYLNRVTPPITQANETIVEVRLEDGTVVNRIVRNRVADFSIGDVDKFKVLPEATRKAVEKIVGHAYEHVSSAISKYVPQVSVKEFSFRDFGMAPQLTVGYRWYDTVDNGLAWYASRGLPRTAQGEYKPMTKNRMYKRMIDSHLGWLDKSWEDYAKEIGPKILSGRQASVNDPIWNDVIPVATRSFLYGRPEPSKPGSAPYSTGKYAPSVQIPSSQTPSTPSGPKVEIKTEDVDLSWMDGLNDDDVHGITFTDINAERVPEEDVDIEHPSLSPDLTVEEAKKQSLSVLMRLAGVDPLINVKAGSEPVISDENKIKISYLSHVLDGVLVPQKYVAYRSFRDAISASLINVANRERVGLVTANKDYVKRLGAQLAAVDMRAKPLIDHAIDDLIKDLNTWKASGKKPLSSNSWDDVISFVEQVRNEYLEPGNPYLGPDYFKGVTNPSINHAYLLGALEALNRELERSIEVVTRLKSLESAGTLGSSDGKLFTHERWIPQYKALIKTVSDRIYNQIDNADLIRELLNQAQDENGIGPKPLAATVIVKDLEGDHEALLAKTEVDAISAAIVAGANEATEKEFEVRLKALKDSGDPDKIELAKNLEEMWAAEKSGRGGTFHEQLVGSLPKILNDITKHGIDDAILPILSHPFIPFVTSRYAMLGLRRYSSFIFARLRSGNYKYNIADYVDGRRKRELAIRRQKDVMANHANHDLADLYQDVSAQVYGEIKTLLSGMSNSDVLINGSKSVWMTKVWKDEATGTKSLQTRNVTVKEAADEIRRAIQNASRRGVSEFAKFATGGKDVYSDTYEMRAQQEVEADIAWQAHFGTSDEVIDKEIAYRSAVRTLAYAMRMSKDPIQYVDVQTFINDKDLHGGIPPELLDQLDSINKGYADAKKITNAQEREARFTELNTRLGNFRLTNPQLKVSPAFAVPVKGYDLRGGIKFPGIQTILEPSEGSGFVTGINIPRMALSSIYDVKLGAKGDLTRYQYHEAKYKAQDAARAAAAEFSLDDPFKATDVASDDISAEETTIDNQYKKIALQRLVVQTSFERLANTDPYKAYVHAIMPILKPEIGSDWADKYAELNRQLTAMRASEDADVNDINHLQDTLNAMDALASEAATELYKHVLNGVRSFREETLDKKPFVTQRGGKWVPATKKFNDQMYQVMLNPSVHIVADPPAYTKEFTLALADAFPGAYKLLVAAHGNKASFNHVLSDIHRVWSSADSEDRAQYKDIALDVMTIYAMSDQLKTVDDGTKTMTSGTNLSPQLVSFSQTLLPEEYFHLMRLAYNRMLAPGVETTAISETEAATITSQGKGTISETVKSLATKMNAREMETFGRITNPATFRKVSMLWNSYQTEIANKIAQDKTLPADEQAGLKTPFTQMTTLEQMLELIHGATSWDVKHPYKGLASEFVDDLGKRVLGSKTLVKKFARDISSSLLITPTGWITDKWIPDVVQQPLKENVDQFQSDIEKAFVHGGQPMHPKFWGRERITEPIHKLELYNNILNQYNNATGGVNRTVFTDTELRAIANLHVGEQGGDNYIPLFTRNQIFSHLVEGRRLAIVNPLKGYLGRVAEEKALFTMADINNYMSDNNYSHADRIGVLNQIIGHMSATRSPLKATVIAMGRLPLKNELGQIYLQTLAPTYRAKAKNSAEIKKKIKDKTEAEQNQIIDKAAMDLLSQEYLKLSDYVTSRNFANFMDMVSVTDVNVLSRRAATTTQVTGITLGTSVNRVNIHEIAVHGTFLALSDVFNGNALVRDYLSRRPMPSWIGSTDVDYRSIARDIENDIVRLNTSNIAELIFNPSRKTIGQTYSQAGGGLTAPGAGKNMTETSLSTRQSSVKARFGSNASEQAIFVEQMRTSVANAFQAVLTRLDPGIVRSLPLPVKKIEGRTLVNILTNQYQMQASDKNQKLVTALRGFAKGYVASVLQGRREFVRALNDDSLNNNRYEKQYDGSGVWDGRVLIKDQLTNVVLGEIDYKNGTVVDANGKSKLVGVNGAGFNAAQVALMETFMALDKSIDANTPEGLARIEEYRNAINGAINLRTVPAEYWHGRQMLEQEDDAPVFEEPLYMSTEHTNEHYVNETVGAVDPSTREQFVHPRVRTMLTPNNLGIERLKITSDGTPAYNGEGYHVLTPDGVYSHTYAKLVAAGLSPDKALEVYTLTEHPLFQNWMHGDFIDNVHMHNYGTFNTQGRRMSPELERRARVVLKAKNLEVAADAYIQDKSKANFENLKFAFDEALGSGLTKEELNEKLNNITADKHKDVQFPLTLLAHVETARELAQPYMSDEVMAVVRPTVAYQTIAKQVKTGKPFTTMAFDYEGDGPLKFNAPGWKVHDLGSGLHKNDNRSNGIRAIRFQNPLVYDAHQDGTGPIEMEAIVKRAFDEKRDGIILTNVAEGMFDDNYRNIAITMHDSNVRHATSLLLDIPGEPSVAAKRTDVEPLFMTISTDAPDSKVEEWIDRHGYKPVWDLNTATSVPELRDEDVDWKPTDKLSKFKDGAIRFAMWVSAEFQQAMRGPLGVDFAFLGIHTGKASPLTAIMTGRKEDAVVWATAFASSLRYTRPNTSVMLGNKRLGMQDKLGRRAFVERYMYWRTTFDDGKWMKVFVAHNMTNIGLVQFEKNVEQAKNRRYRQLHREGVNIKYRDIHMNLMDFDEQGFHADLYEVGTLQGMLPIIGIAGRQIAAHSDEFVMQMTVSWIKSDPELRDMTAEQLGESDKVYKIMKFLSLAAGQFQYTTNERADAIIGLIGKIFMQAPRWALSNIFFSYFLNPGLSQMLGKAMGGRDNRSLDIFVHPQMSGLWTAMKKDVIVRKQMQMSVLGGLVQMVGAILLTSLGHALLQYPYNYLIRQTNKLGGVRLYDWEYKPTNGYLDWFNKGAMPITKAVAASGERPKAPTRQNETPDYDKTLQALRPYGWGLSPVLTRPVGWVTGKDAIGNNLYEFDRNVDYVWNKIWGPRLEKITGQKMPPYLYVPRLYTEQWWSWIGSGLEAARKADDFNKSPQEAEAIGLAATVLSAFGTGWQYNPEPTERTLQQWQLVQQRRRNLAGDKPLSAVKPEDLVPKFKK